MYSSANFNNEHLAMIKRLKKKQDNLINKLKKQVEKKGYYENLGNKEYQEFKEYLIKQNVQYGQRDNWLGYLQQDIDNI